MSIPQNYLRAVHREPAQARGVCFNCQQPLRIGTTRVTVSGNPIYLCGNCSSPPSGEPTLPAKATLPPKQATRPEKRIVLNKTEQRMLALLKYREQKGEIRDVRVMPMSLKWGLDEQMHYMTYSPDFSYISDAGVTLVEVKGAHIRDRDIARFKGCRADWPGVNFVMWQWKNGSWQQLY